MRPTAPQGLFEAVPNCSEGRSTATIAGISARAGSLLLDVHADPSHHRSVLTLAGGVAELREAALALFEAAVERIDLRRHRGEHPRVGALDVLPIAPLGETLPGGASLADAAGLARELAETIGAAGSVPVFLYGEADAPRRRPLPEIRRGGLGGLAERLDRGGIVPDFGPRALHPSAGAVCVGARPLLIAFNVNLDTEEIETARSIARRIRSSGGGLPALRAIAVRQRDSASRRVLAQVSMNLLDWRRTPLDAVFARVLAEAGAAGTGVVHSEIVGLAPEAATWRGMEMDLALREPARTIEGVYAARRLRNPP